MSDTFSLAMTAQLRPALISCAWFALLHVLVFQAVRCFRAALNPGAYHSLVSLAFGTLLLVLAILVGVYVRPDLRWGAVVVGGPVMGVLLSTLRPRRRRYRSGY